MYVHLRQLELHPLQPFPHLTPSTCRRLEAFAAANSLGVPSANVRLLGVEDGGLVAAP
jgi:hypothetical protein